MYGRAVDDPDSNNYPKRPSLLIGCLDQISEIKMSRTVAQDVPAAIRRYQEGKSQHPGNKYKTLTH